MDDREDDGKQREREQRRVERPSKVSGLIAGLAGWIVGILVASLNQTSYLYMMPIVIAVGILLWPDRRKAWSDEEKNIRTEQKLFLKKCAIGLVMMSLAILRYSSTNQTLERKIAQMPFEQNVELVGMVVISAETTTNGSQFVIKGSFRKDKEKLLTDGQKIKLQIREREGIGYAYGDKVVVIGKLEKPEPFETTSGGTFDYPNFLKKDGIIGIVKAKNVTLSKKGKPSPLRILFGLNKKLEDITKELIPGTKGMLATGVLLGDRDITKENQEEFITTGTVHIIALSGYNVSIVANFFRELFSFLPLVGALTMGGFAILLFVIMTGFQSTAVRAGVMAGIVLFAKAKGRNAPTGRVIVFAACIMTVINPYTLYYDVSSQLSFLATLGIIYFAPRIAHWFARVPEKVAGLPLREMLTGTIGTQIFVLPYLLYKTGTLSVVSPITNILIIPFIPYLMVFSSIVAILGVVYFPIAMPFALIGGVISVIILFIIHITAQIPLAAFTVKMPLVVMLMVYAFLFHYFDPFGMRKVDITKKESKV